MTEITWRCDAAYLVIYPELEIVGFTDPRPATFPGHTGSAFLSARLFPNSGLSASRHSCTSPSALRPAAFEPGPGCLSFFSDPVGLALTLVKRSAFGTHFCETAIRIGIQESTGRAAITGQESLKNDWWPAGMPGPLSSTMTWRFSAVAFALNTTRPPPPAAWAAFATPLVRICSKPRR